MADGLNRLPRIHLILKIAVGTEVMVKLQGCFGKMEVGAARDYLFQLEDDVVSGYQIAIVGEVSCLNPDDELLEGLKPVRFKCFLEGPQPGVPDPEPTNHQVHLICKKLSHVLFDISLFIEPTALVRLLQIFPQLFEKHDEVQRFHLLRGKHLAHQEPHSWLLTCELDLVD